MLAVLELMADINDRVIRNTSDSSRTTSSNSAENIYEQLLGRIMDMYDRSKVNRLVPFGDIISSISDVENAM